MKVTEWWKSIPNGQIIQLHQGDIFTWGTRRLLVIRGEFYEGVEHVPYTEIMQASILKGDLIKVCNAFDKNIGSSEPKKSWIF